MNEIRPALIPSEGPAQRRVINLPPPKPTPAEVISLYRQLTIAIWAEALALKHNNTERADQIGQLRERINESIMGAI